MADDIKILVDSSDVVKATKDVSGLDTNVKKLGGTAKGSMTSFERGVKGINQFGRVASAGGKDMNRFNMVLQQGGFQLQDFIVQLQGGTSFFTAFSQQGSQFAGIFGPAGAVFGAVIALGSAIGGLSFALLRGEKDSRTFQEAVEDLTKSVSEYSKAMEAAKSASASVTEEFGFTSTILESIVRDFETLAKLKVFDELSASVEKLRSEHISGFYGDLENIAHLLRMEGWFASLSDGVANFDALLKDVENSAFELEHRISAALTLKDILLENSGGIQNMEEDQLKFYEALLLSIQQMEVLRGLTSDEVGQQESLARIKRIMGEFEAKRIKDQQELFRLQQKVSREHEAYLPTVVQQREESDKYVTSVVTVLQKTEALRKELGDAAFEALRLGGVDMTSGVDSAAKAAARLAADLNISLAAALAMQSMASDEEAVMSQPVVKGSVTDRYDVDTLLGMGYTKEYLKSIGKIKDETGGTTKADPADQIKRFMAQQEQANEIQRERILLGEESARVTELVNKYKEAGIPLDMKRIQNLAREEQELQKLQSAHTSLTDALMSVVDGTQSVGDAFKGLIRDMILDIYREKVAKSFASTVFSLFGFANGGVFSNGSQVNAFADGGVVGGPTYFPMSGGQTGLMGEAGPEAIMPLKRGADGKLGVQMNGGGEQVVVNQNINISTGVQQTVRNEIQSMMPQIAAQSKSAVLDAKRRGGSYGGKF